MGVKKDSKSVIIVLKGWFIVLVSNVRVSNTNQLVKVRPFAEKCRGASTSVQRQSHTEKCIKAFNIL